MGIGILDASSARKEVRYKMVQIWDTFRNLHSNHYKSEKVATILDAFVLVQVLEWQVYVCTRQPLNNGQMLSLLQGLTF